MGKHNASSEDTGTVREDGSERLKELARENRESHERVKESLREAERIAERAREASVRASA